MIHFGFDEIVDFGIYNDLLPHCLLGWRQFGNSHTIFLDSDEDFFFQFLRALALERWWSLWQQQ